MSSFGNENAMLFSLAPCLLRNRIPVARDGPSWLAGPELGLRSGPWLSSAMEAGGSVAERSVVAHLSRHADSLGVRCHGASRCPSRDLDIYNSFSRLSCASVLIRLSFIIILLIKIVPMLMLFGRRAAPSKVQLRSTAPYTGLWGLALTLRTRAGAALCGTLQNDLRRPS